MPDRPTLSISPAACILGALGILILPLKWLLAALTAAVIHELFHIAAVTICTGKIRNLRIGSTGAIMEAAPMSRGKALFCTLAGPIGGLMLLPLSRWLPRLAFCGAVHSLYNLLPLQTLDGGKALRCILQLLMPEPYADRICGIIQTLCLLAVMAFALYLWVWLRLGFFPVMLAGMLWLQKHGRKTLQTAGEKGTIVLP